MARRFNSQQRVALYLASGGRCAVCGVELEPGWHADHIAPWARGGETDVVNGQALCPTCNLKKGDGMTTETKAQTAIAPRAWQDSAWTHYEAVNKRVFLCCACPGAGKTRWTLALARRLLDNGTVKRVVVIAPSRSVRDQWKDQRIVHLESRPNEDGGHEVYADFEGSALTYAQIAMQPDLQRKACYDRSTLVIFDEIHHAGDDQSWGEKLVYAFEHATRIIGLTGTPWRRPKSGRIPFVTYDSLGHVQPDYEYSYGQAVGEDRVCRIVQFHAYDAQIQCVELETAQSVSRSLSDLTDVQDRSQAMTAILDTKRDWMRVMLEKGHAELKSIRAGNVDDGAVPDAQGLVIADDQNHAREIARLLERITGEAPELIISDEPDAEDALKRFGRGSRRWAVAVNKVSEGVDVASLYVGVYATRKTSPLLFRQIVGRFVRRRGSTETRDAVMFMPAVPDLMQLASEIQDELRHAIELALDEAERERKQMEQPREPGEPDLRVWEANDATLTGVIRSGESFTSTEVSEAQQYANRLKADGLLVDPIVLAAYERMRQREAPRTAQPDVVTQPGAPHAQSHEMTREDQKRALKVKLDKLAKKAAIETGTPFDEFNQNLFRRFGKSRSALTMDEIRQQIDFIQNALNYYREHGVGIDA